MLRLAPPGFERFLQSPQFQATFGGGEANVAVALAQLGSPAAYVTVLPESNAIGDAAIGELRRFGVTLFSPGEFHRFSRFRQAIIHAEDACAAVHLAIVLSSGAQLVGIRQVA